VALTRRFARRLRGYRLAVPTRAQVKDLLDSAHSCETAARALHVHGALALMVAPGLPAKGSDLPAPEELRDGHVPAGGSQQLVSTPAFDATRRTT
jgi:hypothetical protein